MVNSDINRKAFINSSIILLRKWKFDGLDLDWEYPASRPSGEKYPGDKKKLTQLCKELIEAFDKDATKLNKTRLLLTAAVGAGKNTIDAAYERNELGKYLDILNLMTYDMHDVSDNMTGHHAAMANDGGSTNCRKEFTVPYAVDYWIAGGFPANKIALGLATYGRAFSLVNEKEHGLTAATSYSTWPGAPKGQFTDEAGLLAYYEICKMNLTVVQDSVVGAPYGYKGKSWIGYDDKASLVKKVKSQIKAKKLAGAMFWALDYDDFNGTQCNEGKYPLMTAVAQELGDYTPPKHQ